MAFVFLHKTINFAQDFLVYSRDRLLSLKHDRAASEKPLNVPELLQSGSVMVELWRCQCDAIDLAHYLAHSAHRPAPLSWPSRLPALRLGPRARPCVRRRAHCTHARSCCSGSTATSTDHRCVPRSPVCLRLPDVPCVCALCAQTQGILEPHCSAKVIRSFDQISGWYLEEDKIAGILRRDECLDLLKRLDRSLHAVIERY